MLECAPVAVLAYRNQRRATTCRETTVTYITLDSRTPPLRPDLSEARQSLAAIDTHPAAQFGFRSLDDRGDDVRLAVKCYGTLDRGIRQSKQPGKNGQPCRPGNLLSFMQGKGAGAFFVPNQLDGQGQLKRNVVAIRALYVDADSRREVERLHAFIAATSLEPTALVASGGVHNGIEKQQSYWRVSGCPVDEFTTAQLRLVSRIGPDPAVQDPGRVMRLPGFWHQKREPRQTRIVSIDSNAEYDYREFMACVLARPQFCDPWAGGKGRGGAPRRTGAAQTDALIGPKARLRVLLDGYGGLLTPAVRALLGEAITPTEGRPGNRHATLTMVVARCIQAGWPDGDVRALVLPTINGLWGDGDWRAHLDSIIAWTRQQEAAAIATMPAAPASIAAAFGAAGAL